MIIAEQAGWYQQFLDKVAALTECPVQCESGYIFSDGTCLSASSAAQQGALKCPVRSATCHYGIKHTAERAAQFASYIDHQDITQHLLLPCNTRAVLWGKERCKLDGRIYGWHGPTGSGKTVAMASTVFSLNGYKTKGVSWLHARDLFSGSQRRPEWLPRFDCRIIAIDDLGTEAVKGDYGREYNTAVFDEVVDIITRRKITFFYTTNLPTLSDNYGKRAISRMFCRQDYVTLTGEPDYRSKNQPAL